MRKIELLDVYQHYKGDKYQVIALAKHSETMEDLVIYRNIETLNTWARPEKMFLEKVKGNRLRFKLISR